MRNTRLITPLYKRFIDFEIDCRIDKDDRDDLCGKTHCQLFFVEMMPSSKFVFFTHIKP